METLTQVKRCSKCKEEKPVFEFTTNRAMKDGLSRICNQCEKEYRKKTYNSERACRYTRKWVVKNRDRVNDYQNNRRFDAINNATEKVCTKCKVLKPVTEFYKRKPTPKHYTPYRTQCKACDAIDNKRRILVNSDWRKNWNLKKKWGITFDEYKVMLANQGGVCAVCGNPPEDDSMGHKLAVDHDHKYAAETGRIKIRGLLCRHCNIGIGKLGDTIEGLMRAVEYLRRSQ